MTTRRASHPKAMTAAIISPHQYHKRPNNCQPWFVGTIAPESLAALVACLMVLSPRIDDWGGVGAGASAVVGVADGSTAAGGGVGAGGGVRGLAIVGTEIVGAPLYVNTNVTSVELP